MVSRGWVGKWVDNLALDWLMKIGSHVRVHTSTMPDPYFFFLYKLIFSRMITYFQANMCPSISRGVKL